MRCYFPVHPVLRPLYLLPTVLMAPASLSAAASVEIKEIVTLEPVVLSQSDPNTSVDGLLRAKVSVAAPLLSTDTVAASLFLRASCEGTDTGATLLVDGAEQTIDLPTRANAQKSYEVSLEWESAALGDASLSDSYICNVEAVLLRTSGTSIKTLSSALFPLTTPWEVESYSAVQALPATVMSDGTLSTSEALWLEVFPPGQESGSPVSLHIPTGAVFSASTSPNSDGNLVVAVDLLEQEDIPQGNEALIGLGQVVSLLPGGLKLESGIAELTLPVEGLRYESASLLPVRYDLMKGEWVECDVDTACIGFERDTTEGVLRVETTEFSEWTTIDGNSSSWLISFLSDSGQSEVQIATGRSNSIRGALTVVELESTYSESGTPVTDALVSPFVRWVTTSSSYPAEPGEAVGLIGNGTDCSEYASNCPFNVEGVNQPVGTFYLQAVLTLGDMAYKLGTSDWLDTKCPEPSTESTYDRYMYHCLPVRSVQLITWYRDSDNDKYGNPALSVEQETQPSGYVSNKTDCNDSNSTIYPGANEVIGNEIDNDCKNGEICYADADGDGYRSNTGTIVSADADCKDAGEAASSKPSEDCDGNKDSNPGKTEVCDANNLDEDCDGLSDDADSGGASDKTKWYYDSDNDTYGTSSYQTRCDTNGAYRATRSGDCDDSNANRSPDKTEVCDAANLDEDCDSVADDADTGGASDKTTWYYDSDNDTYGISTTYRVGCDASGSYRATRSGDCDDANANRNPGKTEVCDASNVDEDCDGTADDSDSSVTGKTTWYYDSDNDTYGTSTSQTRCDANGTYRATGSGDCDDNSASSNPGKSEICDSNNVDEDCDSAADDGDSGGASGKTLWYYDYDNDTYGTSVSETRCDGSGYYRTTRAGDCNDQSSTIHPGASDSTTDGIDSNCDGQEEYPSEYGDCTVNSICMKACAKNDPEMETDCDSGCIECP